jgi:hypothetical protein
VGGEVAPGIKLVETHADYVVLESNGTRHRVDLSKAPAASDGVAPASIAAPIRNDAANSPKGPLSMIDHLTPEQRSILQRQQQELIRGRH